MFVTLAGEGAGRLDLTAAPGPATAAAMCGPLEAWFGEPQSAFLTARLAWPSAHDRLQFRAVAETPSSA
jgi:hypothetical protein